MANCGHNGISSIDAKGTKSEFSDAQVAIDAASEGSVLDLGNLEKMSDIKVKIKKKLTIKSSCRSKIQSIFIGQSENIRIEGLDIVASDASAVQLGEDDQANSNIQLVDLNLTGFRMSKHGINIGAKNKSVNIDNVNIRFFLYQGIVIKSNVTGLTINRATIQQNERNGILIIGESEITVQDSLISGNGRLGLSDKSAGFGVFIQNEFNGSKKEKIQLLNNRILFNLGALDQRLDSDIEGTAMLTLSQGNLTTYGVEGTGFSRWDISSVTNKPQEAKDMIANAGGPKTKFLRNYSDVVQLASVDFGLSSDNFTYIREKHMDRCIYVLGDDAKKVISKLLFAINGQDFKNVANYLDRSPSADRSITLETISSLCEEFSN